MALERHFLSLWPNGPLDAFAAYAAQFGLYVCIAIAIIAWARRRPRGLLIPLALAAVVAAAAVWTAGAVHQEARPFMVLGVAPLVPHNADNAFPSDHSAAAAYVSTAALFIDPAYGIAAWVFAAVLGVGRLYCLLHSPIDVLAGWILGGVPALIAGGYWRRNVARRRKVGANSTAM